MIENGSIILESAQRGEDRSIVVDLFGEIDVRYLRILEDTLRDCLASGRPTFVDLSGVTFMDSLCVRELTVHYRLGRGYIVLCDPSPEVRVGVAACDLEGWFEFVYTAGLEPPPICAATRASRDAAM